MSTTTTTPTGQWISPQQIADELDVSYSGACLLIRRGDIPGVRIGRSLRVRRSDFDEYLSRQRITHTQRRELLGDDTMKFLADRADNAGPLSDAQQDIIRSAFQGVPRPPQPRRRKGGAARNH